MITSMPTQRWPVNGRCPVPFAFAHLDAEAVVGKTRQAFANAFLGLPSLGRSTFATVTHADAHETEAVIELLADHILTDYAAPDLAAARAAAVRRSGICCGSVCPGADQHRLHGSTDSRRQQRRNRRRVSYYHPAVGRWADACQDLADCGG